MSEPPSRSLRAFRGAVTVRGGGRIAELDILADPDRLAELDLALIS